MNVDEDTAVAPDETGEQVYDAAGAAKVDDYGDTSDAEGAVAGAISRSFDCAKDGSATEHLICSDATLAEPDLAMAATHKRARTVSTDPSAIKAEQGEWLRNQPDVCQDVVCMSTAYHSRLAQLND